MSSLLLMFGMGSNLVGNIVEECVFKYYFKNFDVYRFDEFWVIVVDYVV